jgi:pyruvate dehydrogenase phosphatase
MDLYFDLLITLLMIKSSFCALMLNSDFLLLQGIARRLVKAALKEAARKREMRYNDITKLEKGVRRFFHDDITVVVVFIDHGLLQEGSASAPELSVRGFVESGGPSTFSGLNSIP